MARLSVLLKIPMRELRGGAGAGSARLVPPRARAARPHPRGGDQGRGAQARAAGRGRGGRAPARVSRRARFAAHLLGYVREVSDEQMKQGRYRRGDMIGPERPRAAARRAPARPRRRRAHRGGCPRAARCRSCGARSPIRARQVITTVDRRIQEAAERAMVGTLGRGDRHGSAQRRRPRHDLEPRVRARPADREPRPGRVAQGRPGSAHSADEPGACRASTRPGPSSRSSWRRRGCRKAR